jgi:ATP-dependent Clp protease adaptor protein ClpS
MAKYQLTLNNDEQDDHDSGIAIAPEKQQLKAPSLYQVLMLNDDFTPMEFVVEVLAHFFSMNEEKATQIMLTVHGAGKAVCGVFSKDVAETKAALVNQYARDSGHPLLCEIQAVD